MSNQVEMTDHLGERWYKYTCSYTSQHGTQSGFSLWATSDADAKVRMEALRGSARVDGRICTTIALGGGVIAQSSVPEPAQKDIH